VMLEGVLLVSGHTARGKAYAQAMRHQELEPQWVILYGQPKSGRPGQENAGGTDLRPQVPGIYLPDLTRSLEQEVSEAGWSCESLPGAGINSRELLDAIAHLDPRLVVFCGYGGEIVRGEALALAPFLHIHAGWLPDFRGSTTGYYSLIEENCLGATALLLDEKIDTGRMLLRKRYAPPPPGIDMDYVYEPAIRADLLTQLLRQYADKGALPAGTAQSELGRTYYVVHPVLKHLALLRIGAR
jgi:methionyl-tRNA formyltransferase